MGRGRLGLFMCDVTRYSGTLTTYAFQGGYNKTRNLKDGRVISDDMIPHIKAAILRLLNCCNIRGYIASNKIEFSN